MIKACTTVSFADAADSAGANGGQVSVQTKPKYIWERIETTAPLTIAGYKMRYCLVLEGAAGDIKMMVSSPTGHQSATASGKSYPPYWLRNQTPPDADTVADFIALNGPGPWPLNYKLKTTSKIKVTVLGGLEGRGGVYKDGNTGHFYQSNWWKVLGLNRTRNQIVLLDHVDAISGSIKVEYKADRTFTYFADEDAFAAPDAGEPTDFTWNYVLYSATTGFIATGSFSWTPPESDIQKIGSGESASGYLVTVGDGRSADLRWMDTDNVFGPIPAFKG